MRTALQKLALLGRILRSYLIAWTFGGCLGAIVFFFMRCGRIQIRELDRLKRAAFDGRTIILTNHPSLLAETFLLGAVIAPLYLKNPRRAFWTMPDAQLLDLWRMPRWLRNGLQCIEVDRRSPMKSGRAAVQAMKVLRQGGSIIAHPEMGRTFGNANKGKTPLVRKNRAMQKIDGSSLTLIASKSGALILPGWVDVPYAQEALPLGACIWRLFTQRGAIVFSFLEPPYRPEEPFDLIRENARLQEKIFDA
jgi:1-acyl-sn-glycerol-3-phosphate acyltransferase